MYRTLQPNRPKIRNSILSRALIDNITREKQQNIIEEIPDITVWRMDTHDNSLVM